MQDARTIHDKNINAKFYPILFYHASCGQSDLKINFRVILQKKKLKKQCHLNDYECIILTIQCRTLTLASQRYMILNSKVSMKLQ